MAKQLVLQQWGLTAKLWKVKKSIGNSLECLEPCEIWLANNS